MGLLAPLSGSGKSPSQGGVAGSLGLWGGSLGARPTWWAGELAMAEAEPLSLGKCLASA